MDILSIVKELGEKSTLFLKFSKISFGCMFERSVSF